MPLQTKTILLSGGLNQDDDPSLLPEGDYVDANNVVIDTSLTGGKGSVKQMEGHGDELSLSITGGVTSGNVKATFTDTNNDVYFLLADSTNASIGKISNDVVTTVLTRYNHGSCSIDHPDLKKVGDILVWNYYGGGTPLSWYIGRSAATDPDLEDLTLIKEPPVYSPEITVNTSTTASVFTFEDRSHQFAYRYKYDSGEVSALSPYSEFVIATSKNPVDTVAAARVDPIESITLDYNSSNTAPTYYDKIEWYTRTGDDGIWFRIGTKSTTDSITFKGERYEALDTVDGSKPFDTIPFETNSVDVIDNRIWLANNKDDFDASDFDSISLAIAAGNGSTTGTGSSGTGYCYLDKSASTHSRDEDKLWFANNSTYTIGVAFYDDYLRTRGVESTVSFTSGDFDYPAIPTLEITKVSTPPSWAKYYQVAVTENQTKDYVYEGYASSIYYIKDKINPSNDLDETYETLGVNDSARDKFKYMVVDLSGMFEAGHIYSFNDGDRIRGYLAQGETGSIQDAQIIGQQGSQVYVDVTGLNLLDGTYLKSTTFQFYTYAIEIYSPKPQASESVFFEQGTMYPISNISSLTGSNTWDLELKGDTFMHHVEVPLYDNLPRVQDKAVLNLLDGIPFTDLTQVYFELTSTSQQFEKYVSFDNDNATEGFAYVGETGSYYFDLNLTSPSSTDINLEIIQVDPSDNSETRLYAFPTFNSGSANFEAVIQLTAGTIMKIEHNASAGNLNTSTLTIARAEDTLDISNGYYTYSTENVGTSKLPLLFRGISKSKRSTVWDRNKGKPLVEVDRSSVSNRNESGFRYGRKYIEGTKINPVSSFSFTQAGEVPFENGPINALVRTNKVQSQGNVLLAISSNESAAIYVNERVVTDQNGADVFSAVTDTVGTIRNLKGSYGLNISDRNSVVSYKGNVYWWDRTNKSILRYGRNGVIPISDLKMRKYFQGMTDCGLAYFDPFYQTYNIQFSTPSSKVISFSEDRNRWTTFLDITGDIAPHVERNYYIIDGVNARKSLHTTFGTFGGTEYNADITPVLNLPAKVQIFNARLKVNGDVPDYSNPNYLKTNLLNLVTTNDEGQQTTLKDLNFEYDNGLLFGAFLRDENGPGDIITGNYIVGTNHQFKLTIEDQSEQYGIVYLTVAFSTVKGDRY